MEAVVDPGGEIRAWVESRLGVVKITEHRTRPWADIHRVEAASGLWWLKVNSPGTAHEPALLDLLSGTGSRLVPTALTHQGRPWSLIADAGSAARDAVAALSRADQVDFWSGLLAEYADLQRATSAGPLLQAGLTDFRPQALDRRFAELLDQDAWFCSPAIDWDEAQRDRIARLVPRVSAAAAELASGVAATVQHDDLHDHNVLLQNGDLGRPRVIDWGDATVAHPFGTLRLTLSTLRREFDGPGADADLDRITAAYLEGWRTGGTTEAELRRQVRLSWWLECLARSACWIRALGSVQSGLDTGFAGSPAGWLGQLADEAEALPLEVS